MDTPDSPSPRRRRRASPAKAATAKFTPVVVRPRHDGWTPERQRDFIAALAESACVAEACAAVGMTAKAAYRLRARPDANTFRQAWDIALDYGVRRLADAAFSRALHGVVNPVFFQGEQVGERRHFDERLTMFLLRTRDPVRYGAWLDKYEARRHPDGVGIVLAHALNSVLDAAHGMVPEPVDPDDPDRPLAEGPPPPSRVPLPDYDGPEEMREVMETLRAQTHAEREASLAEQDPAKAD